MGYEGLWHLGKSDLAELKRTAIVANKPELEKHVDQLLSEWEEMDSLVLGYFPPDERQAVVETLRHCADNLRPKNFTPSRFHGTPHHAVWHMAVSSQEVAGRGEG